ncbi:putative quinol monooxygenase [Ruegeria sp. EL01]|jgi:quinol monooxygenase YgiN|uniref:putative quinol monooxygenase n=1 Tax=Ruegeria sp. EL01 TaxID=2107578 RepID=UPI000EA813B0|nr:antibiotic biosynthesis monooxygenase [Ruegeria sp. EL01]
MNADPFVVIVTMNLKPGVSDEFHASLEPVLNTMRSEETFVNTIVHTSKDNPNHIMLYETWLDYDDFIANQITRPYRDDYWKKLEVLLESPPDREFFFPLRGDFVFQNGRTQSLPK